MALLIVGAVGCGRLGFDDQQLGGADGGAQDGGPDATPGTITITIAGDGDWQIVSSPAAIDCPGSCSATFPSDSQVTLTAAGPEGGQLGSWGTPDCPNAVETCAVSASQGRTMTVRVRGRRNVAFMTTNRFDIATIGDLDGADALCSAAADQAGLSGPFIAFLSSAAADMFERLPDFEGWVRPDGKELARSAESLLNGRLLRRVTTPTGGAPQTYASTTDLGGEFNGMDCAAWTDPLATIGSARTASNGADFFGLGTGAACDGVYRLFCVGVDPALSGPLVLPEFESRRIFVTKGEMPTVTGVSGFDAACEAEAASGGASGTYLAMVASPSTSIASRFDNGLPWARADGVLIADTSELLLSGEIDASVLFAVDGDLRLGAFWSGAPGGPDSIATNPSTCDNWTLEAVDSTGSIGLAQSADHFHQLGGATCNSVLPVVCAQQ